ncbi:MAG: hypothetical protein MZV70_49410 [Desulfobacterales bacterium]|nr:hypothetical protein [Desulfobacterales bacterium]
MNRNEKRSGDWMPALLLTCPLAVQRHGPDRGGEGHYGRGHRARPGRPCSAPGSSAEIESLYVEGFFHGRTVPSRMTVRRPNLVQERERRRESLFLTGSAPLRG